MVRAWGFWTRYKLELLERYLDAFTTTTRRRSSKSVYLDLFGGEPDNVDRDSRTPIEGSARIALNTGDPPFTHLRFFELKPNATKLRRALSQEFPTRDWRVYPGDSNDTIRQALSDLWSSDAGWAPTFAFIDPNGPHYTWGTIQALARHKAAKATTKVELWMLFPGPLFARMLPLSGDVRPHHNAAITAMFGDPQWHAIWTARLAHEITPADARTEYVNLMRWRLQNVLGYRWTHQLEIRNTRGPIYHMIFATDSEAGNDIMSYLYDQAAAEFPAMEEEARSRSRRLRREASGQFDLFTTSDIDPTWSTTSPPATGIRRVRLYFYEPPDEPRQHDGRSCPYCG